MSDRTFKWCGPTEIRVEDGTSRRKSDSTPFSASDEWLSHRKHSIKRGWLVEVKVEKPAPKAKAKPKAKTKAAPKKSAKAPKDDEKA